MLVGGLGMVMLVLVWRCRTAPTSRSKCHLLGEFVVGGSFGVSIFGVLFATLLDDKLAALLPPGALSSAGLSPEALTGTPEQIQALPPDILLPVTQAMADSITAIFLCTVPLLAIGVAIAIVVPELPLKDTAHIGSTLEGAEITVAEMAGGEAAVDELTSRRSLSTRTGAR
jgi:hypothetical protein